MKTIEIKQAIKALLSTELSDYQFYTTRPNNLIHDPEEGETDLPACAIYFESAGEGEDIDVDDWTAEIHIELFDSQSNDVDDVLEAHAKTVIDAMATTDLDGLLENASKPKFIFNRDPETELTSLDLTFILQWEE